MRTGRHHLPASPMDRGPGVKAPGPRLASPLGGIAIGALLLLGLLLPACGGRASRGLFDPEDPPARLVHSGQNRPDAEGFEARGQGAITPALRATFRTLAGAIASGDDRLASGILDRLAATPLGSNERRLADNLKRVLRGRQLSQALELHLELLAGDRAGRWRLELELSQGLVGEVTLHLPPARLIHRRHRVDARGVGSREARTRLLEFFDDLTLTSSEPVRLTLAELDVPMRGALALRDEWHLELLGGTVVSEGVEYPASAFRAADLERTFLADFLPNAPVEPDELVTFASRPNPATAPLMERAVRIPASQACRALEALEPLLLRFASEDPQRTIPLTPALRWLSRTEDPGLDPSAWMGRNEDPGVDPLAWVRKISAQRRLGQERDREQAQERERLTLPPGTLPKPAPQPRGKLRLPPLDGLPGTPIPEPSDSPLDQRPPWGAPSPPEHP